MVTVRSHTSAPAQTRRRRARDCRHGRHAFDQVAIIGGGIMRRVCTGCGHVTINLAAPNPDADPFS